MENGKKIYNSAEIEVANLTVQDVITTSDSFGYVDQEGWDGQA